MISNRGGQANHHENSVNEDEHHSPNGGTQEDEEDFEMKMPDQYHN